MDLMGYRSEIDWTDATWNPVRSCAKVSPGCQHCYAERFAERFRGVPGHPFESGFDPKLVPAKLDAPLKWGAPRRIFVNSMSDLFHEAVATDYIARLGEVMRVANWHTFQVLTKRHERMDSLLNGRLRQLGLLANVWWGVSVEDRR
jgi:protein gp37